MSIEASYLKHQRDEANNRQVGELPFTFTNPDYVDAWLHDNMRNQLLPLFEHAAGTTWITVGDGNFGSDAHYLGNKGLDVLATSISADTISVAHQQGYIEKFKAVNAERMPEADASFDFVYCKEAFHHFPRPYIALYEMLRVARQGVVMIEPQQHKTRLLDHLKRWLKKWLRHDSSDLFEPVGNFIFRIDVRDLSKVMTAMNLRHIAYKRFNSFYLPANSRKSIHTRSVRLTTHLGIWLQDMLCGLRLMDHGLAAVILFKGEVDPTLRKRLQQSGFVVDDLPVNQYL